MKILVVGAGATGGYFGLCLARSGRTVSFLVRPRRAVELKERGLRVVGEGWDEKISPQLVTAQEISAPYDLILLAVKATGLASAMVDFAPAVGATTVIAPFLNGLSHVEKLNQRFGQAAVLGGVARLATTLDQHGDIVRLSAMASLEVGEQQGSASPRLQTLAQELSVDGFKFSLNDHILAAMWQKWVFIVSISAVNVLMRGSIGEVVAVAGGASLGPAIVAEASAVSLAAGFSVPAAGLTDLVKTVAQADSPMTTSLFRDLSQGLSTEVEPMFGEFIAQARQLNVPTPLLDLVTMNLRVYEHRRAHTAV